MIGYDISGRAHHILFADVRLQEFRRLEAAVDAGEHQAVGLHWGVDYIN